MDASWWQCLLIGVVPVVCFLAVVLLMLLILMGATSERTHTWMDRLWHRRQ